MMNILKRGSLIQFERMVDVNKRGLRIRRKLKDLC